jgi:creatinine amidohydrolase
MRHPGTLSLRPGTFLCVLEDLIDSLVRGGFEHVLVLNGHGGNVAPCEAVWDQFLRRFQINLHFLSYWDVLTSRDATEVLNGGSDIPEHMPGHAQEFETSIALAAFPENVRSEAVADQEDSSPALATVAKGQLLLERVVQRVERYLGQMLSGQAVTLVPPFHP